MLVNTLVSDKYAVIVNLSFKYKTNSMPFKGGVNSHFRLPRGEMVHLIYTLVSS